MGIDLVPAKTCSLDCRFCQLGRTRVTCVERREYVPTESVVAELARWIGRGGQADVLTLAGSGEPTLHSGFGRILSWIGDNTGMPSLLLSNGALFADAGVRRDAALANMVKVSLHAWDEPSFRLICRPHPAVRFAGMVKGYRMFRELYDRQLVVEVFVVPGFNDNVSAMGKIARLTAGFHPDRVDLNTASRPCADPDVRPVERRLMARLARCFTPPAVLPAGDGPAGGVLSDGQLVAMLLRHPCDAASLSRFLSVTRPELEKRLAAMAARGVVHYHAGSGCWTAGRDKTGPAITRRQ